MTLHIKQGGVVKLVTDPHVKQSGVVKQVQEGWVKQGGVVKQFFTRVVPNPFGMYQGGNRITDLLVYNYPFPSYSAAVGIDGEDDGTGPYEYTWSMPVANLTPTWYSPLNQRSVSFGVETVSGTGFLDFSGTLRCDVVGTGPGGTTRTLLLPIVISEAEAP